MQIKTCLSPPNHFCSLLDINKMGENEKEKKKKKREKVHSQCLKTKWAGCEWVPILINTMQQRCSHQRPTSTSLPGGKLSSPP
jgi:hypothetical protein